jgi:phosphoribosylamine---glycine ligase
MNILILGSGGREHALAWKIAASPLCTKLFCVPGNAGIAEVAECAAVDIADHQAVIAYARDKAIDFVMVGPEAPLCAGIVDDLEAAGLKAFGPGKWAARLEGSKGFTKDLCKANNIPTAAYQRFKNATDAKAYVRLKGAPIVVKDDGLAAGKGVVVAATLDEAEAAIDMMFGGDGGKRAWEIVVEDCLVGEEASFFALCDGDTAIPLASAQDHKRAGDGDTGPNTGGMGAYSPAPIMTAEMNARVMREIVEPTVRAMKAIGAPFKGVLFAGLMITKDGPQLIEYNVRFGDPETQVLMLRLMSDFLPALLAARDGQLKNISLRWNDDAALTVVMAAKGYPGDYAKGTLIEGLADAAQVEGVEIFHAGTKADGGRILANGGRVLNVSARARTVAEAQARAYAAVDRIRWPEGFCRRDIGWRAVERES